MTYAVCGKFAKQKGVPLARDERMDDDQDDLGNDSPYCECGEQPTEDEEASNQCSCCGKPLS